MRRGLTEEERYRVADDVVDWLQQHGDPWPVVTTVAGYDGQGLFDATD